jgi:hypothetical protein
LLLIGAFGVCAFRHVWADLCRIRVGFVSHACERDGAERRRLGQVLWQQVHVGRERERGRVVAEPDLHLFRVRALAKEGCRAGVAKGVEAEPGDTGARRGRFEHLGGQVPGVQPGARGPREHEVVVAGARLLAQPPQLAGQLL